MHLMNNMQTASAINSLICHDGSFNHIYLLITHHLCLSCVLIHVYACEHTHTHTHSVTDNMRPRLILNWLSGVFHSIQWWNNMLNMIKSLLMFNKSQSDCSANLCVKWYPIFLTALQDFWLWQCFPNVFEKPMFPKGSHKFNNTQVSDVSNSTLTPCVYWSVYLHRKGGSCIDKIILDKQNL